MAASNLSLPQYFTVVANAVSSSTYIVPNYQQWQHPCHPDHLLELHKPTFCNYFKCNGCQMYCNGLAYWCIQCTFCIDMECACIRSTIKHKAHKNPLKIQSQEGNHESNACGNNISDIKFGCQTCRFSTLPTCNFAQ